MAEGTLPDAMGELVVNGRFLTQNSTGVQRVACEVTRAIDRLLGDGALGTLKVRLVVPRGADVARLTLGHIAVDRVGSGAGHWWEQVVLPRHVGRGTLLCLCNSAPIATLLGNGRVAAMLHDQAYLLYPSDYSAAYRLFHSLVDRLLLARARPLLTVSHSERDVLLSRHPDAAADVVVATNGSWIDDGAADGAQPTATPGERYGLYVGGFGGRKNVEAAFTAALALAERKGIGFRFVGARNAAAIALERQIPAHLRTLISFVGFVPNDALATMYRDAVCLIYPSFYEASGLPPSEAMHFGCPVIVSDLPVLRERCGDAAIYCDPRRPAAFQDAALTLADDAQLRASLAAAGRRRTAQLTWRAQALTIVRALMVPHRQPIAITGPSRASMPPRTASLLPLAK